MNCDHPKCGHPAFAEWPLIDDDGEDIGVEMLCRFHHPNSPQYNRQEVLTK